jgi:hypothetical protein
VKKKTLRKFFGWRRYGFGVWEARGEMSKDVNFEKCQKTPPDSNKIEHIFLSFSITMGQSIYEQNIIVCVSNSSKSPAVM